MRIFEKLKAVAVAAVLGVAMLGTSGVANAMPMPITGSIDIKGFTSDANWNGVTGNIVYSQVDQVTDATGALSALNGETPTMFNLTNFTAANLVGQTVWEVATGGWSLVIASVVDIFGNDNIAAIEAVAILKADGYDDTYGTLLLSANAIGNQAGSFSSSTAVPIPASLLLLGSGVVGFGFVSRRRNKKNELAA